jgi:hypothetical protein
MSCRVGIGGCDGSNTNDKRDKGGFLLGNLSGRPISVLGPDPSSNGPGGSAGGRKMLRDGGANTNKGTYAVISNRSNQNLSVYLTKNEKEQGGSAGGRKMLQGGTAMTTSAAALQ